MRLQEASQRDNKQKDRQRQRQEQRQYLVASASPFAPAFGSEEGALWLGLDARLKPRSTSRARATATANNRRSLRDDKQKSGQRQEQRQYLVASASPFAPAFGREEGALWLVLDARLKPRSTSRARATATANNRRSLRDDKQKSGQRQKQGQAQIPCGDDKQKSRQQPMQRQRRRGLSRWKVLERLSASEAASR
jgi:hypothetical protein